MKDDLSGFAEPLRPVVLARRGLRSRDAQRDRDSPFGFEGATIFKANGRYYFGSTDKLPGPVLDVHGASPTTSTAPTTCGMRPCPATAGPDSSGRKTASGTPASWAAPPPRTPGVRSPGIVRVDFAAEGRVFRGEDSAGFHPDQATEEGRPLKNSLARSSRRASCWPACACRGRRNRPARRRVPSPRRRLSAYTRASSSGPRSGPPSNAT